MNDLAVAVEAGYPTVEDSTIAVDPVAARLLAPDERAVGVAMSGDVVLVVLAEIPSPARFAELEAATGMAVSVAIASAETLRGLRSRALAASPGQSDVVLEGVLAEAARTRATDLVLVAGRRPALRVGGSLKIMDSFPHMSELQMAATRSWLLRAGLAADVVTAGGVRWRVRASASAPATIALRELAATPPRPDSVRAPLALAQAAAAEHGLVLVASRAGGGRTTTAASLVEEINASRAVHVVTIGSPVEYQHRSNKAFITAESVTTEAGGARDAVVRATELGAEVIVVEIASVEDARAALEASVAGHLVIATVAAVGVADAIRHLVALFEPEGRHWALQMLAATLRVATAQQLLPTADGAREAVFEVLTANAGVRAAIAGGALEQLQAVLENEVSEGVMSMERALAAHVAAGRVHEGVAANAARARGMFEQHLARVAATGATHRSAGAGASRSLEPASTPAVPAVKGRRRERTGPPGSRAGRG